MSQTNDILFFFPRRFQQENTETEIIKLNKEHDLKDISLLQKSHSVVVSYPKQFVPVLKPKKPLYHSTNVAGFSLDCDNFGENDSQLQRAKSYDKRNDFKFNSKKSFADTRTDSTSDDDDDSQNSNDSNEV